MNITVFGAGGRMGTLVVSELLAKGHSVTAAVHSLGKLKPADNLKVVKCDVYKKDQVAAATIGSQAVISTLGSWGTPKKNVLSEGMKNIIPAMEARKIKKIISLTGAGADAPGDNYGPLRKFSHRLLSLGAPKILSDGENHIEQLSQSDLDWTVIRSPVMTNGANAKYRLDLRPSLTIATIPRRAVVAAMIECLESKTNQRQAPFIHRSKG